MSLTDCLITGFGAVTGAGDELAFRGAWLEGKPSGRTFEGNEEGLPPGYGAVLDFDRKSMRRLPGGRTLRPGTMTNYTYVACGAVGRCLLGAGIEEPSAGDEEIWDRRGVYLGTYTNFPELKKHLKLVHHTADRGRAGEGDYVIDDSLIMEGMKGFTGFDFLKLMNNMPTAHAAIQACARGPANTFLGHAAVGLQAVGKARDTLRLGLADQFVAGGAGAGTLEGLCLVHRGHGTLADPGLEPALAARPLDQDATGLVPGDAGAAVFLETVASAERRGVAPLARIAGYGDRFVAPTGPRGPWPSHQPLVLLIQSVLAEAGWAPSEVDYIAAFGAGLPALDRIEAAALSEAFGSSLPSIALAVHTGITGFTEAGHGALGLVGALQAMVDGRVPPQTNLERPWPELDETPRVLTPRSQTVDKALVLALAPEGTMAALAVERA